MKGGMTSALWIAGAFCLAATVTHIGSIVIAVLRYRRGNSLTLARNSARVSIVRPLCGLENCLEETLRSGFMLGHPDYELIFCVADASDPVVPLVRRLMHAHPAIPSQLLIGDDRISGNPKLNNMVKSMRAARHEWIVFADSNVLMPRDYIARLLACWRPDTGLVCSPPAGCQPDRIWAELEVAFLNSYQARWQTVADTIGMGFAQGKTMLWRRTDLERIGGLETLAAEIAEDAAATKAVRALGLRVRLVAPPFPQPLGLRSWSEVWKRQARWAQLRRATFGPLFALEILSGGFLPFLVAAFAALAADVSIAGVLLGLALLWYGCEALLVRAAGWPLSWRAPFAWALRDLIIPVLWTHAWIANDFVWRGNSMQASDRRPRVAQAARQLLARFTAS